MSVPRRPPLSRRQKPIQRKSWLAKSTKPIKKRGAKSVRRSSANAKYYKSAEWKTKRLAVFERDGFRCTEMWSDVELQGYGSAKRTMRCPNFKERGSGVVLVAEEMSYNHRGIPGAIDRIRTRCQWCDRKRTPQERANWARG